MSKEVLHITVLYGSYRSDRLGIRAVDLLMSKLKGTPHDVEFIDAMEIGLPMLDKRIFDYDEGQAPEVMQKISKIFNKTDAIIVVTGEYNGLVQPGLINLIDHFYPEYANKPMGIVNYSIGAFAGNKAGASYRIMAAGLNMISIPLSVNIPQIDKEINDQGKTDNKQINSSIDKFINQMTWYGLALKYGREHLG